MTLRKILVPVDLSESGTAGLEKACELASATGAELVLLHVLELPIMPPGEAAILPVYVVEEQRSGAEQRLAAMVERASQKGVRARGRLEIGPAYEGILEVARAESPELIVMGTHGRRGLSHLFLGSVAERIVRTSPVPVLTVRPSAAGAAAA